MRNVKPIPSPPMRMLGCFDVRKSWQAKVAIASSEPCMRLDIRTAPSTRMMYSLSRRTSFNAVPSGESVWSSSSKGFTHVMLQQVGYWTNARRLSNSQGRIHRIWRRPSTKDKKRALARSQAPSVQLKSSDTSGITSFSTSASIEARTIFIMGNPEMSTNSGDARTSGTRHSGNRVHSKIQSCRSEA